MLGPTIISDEDGSFRLQRSNQNKGNGAWDTVPEDIPFRKFPKEMPLRRLCMPEDIGKAAVWLCSEEASYVTGACITVDGGQFIETAPSWKTTGRHGES